MAKHIMKATAFRETFTFGKLDVAHWFPGHMHKGMIQMQSKLLDVDCVLEVHDARIPISGRNPMFKDTVSLRPHILVLNKMDLADLRSRDQIINHLHKEKINNVLYTNCKENANSTVKNKIMPAVLKLINERPRYHRQDAEDFNLLIIGVPNVGKSSLINAMRRIHLKKGKATRVGSKAGITRSVLEKIKISEQPKVYLLDTPGILSHDIQNVEVGLKLALCATLQDHLVGEDIIADYMLFKLNTAKSFKYVKHFGLEEPTDDILFFLNHICKQDNLVLRRRSASGGYIYQPDFLRAAKKVLAAFREGRLGKVMLDDEIITKKTDKSANVKKR